MPFANSEFRHKRRRAPAVPLRRSGGEVSAKLLYPSTRYADACPWCRVPVCLDGIPISYNWGCPCQPFGSHARPSRAPWVTQSLECRGLPGRSVSERQARSAELCRPLAPSFKASLNPRPTSPPHPAYSRHNHYPDRDGGQNPRARLRNCRPASRQPVGRRFDRKLQPQRIPHAIQILDIHATIIR